MRVKLKTAVAVSPQLPLPGSTLSSTSTFVLDPRCTVVPAAEGIKHAASHTPSVSCAF